MAKIQHKELQALKVANNGERLPDGNGLYGIVRAGATGVSVLFRWRYRFGGKFKDFNCGTWPGKSLSEIRDSKRQAETAVIEGRDPMTDRQVDRLKAQADQAEAINEQESRLAEIEAQSARMTVMSLFERWERLELKSRKDRGAEVRRSFEKDVLPLLGDIPAEEVKRSMIAACLDAVVERGAPVIARNLLGDLRQMFGYAIKRSFVENDPTSHLKRDDFGKKVERERTLDEGEVRTLFKKLPQADMQPASIATIWIMFSTCCRVGEVSQARWEHLDMEAGTWRIPSDNAKNGKEHTVYLSNFAKVQFQTLHGLSNASPWVMPASQSVGHVCLKSLAKQIGDRQRGDKVPMTNRTKLTQALELPLGKWTPHDLRRTGSTFMGNLGVRPDVIDKCLNHVEPNRLHRIYQRQTLRAEQAEAWRLLGERLELLTSDADNVIALKRVAA